MTRLLPLSIAALGLLTLAACSGTPRSDPRAPTDTGNMAYPTPLPQGSVTTTPVR